MGVHIHVLHVSELMNQRSSASSVPPMLQAVSQAPPPAEAPAPNPEKKKRLRAVIVCTHCRKRKIKCDKQQPCLNCVKVNMADSCHYDRAVKPRPKPAPLQGTVRENEGYVGQFAINEHAAPPAQIQIGSADGLQSELEVLKHRLRNIERSLLDLAAQPEPKYAKATPFVDITIPQNRNMPPPQGYATAPVDPYATFAARRPELIPGSVSSLTSGGYTSVSSSQTAGTPGDTYPFLAGVNIYKNESDTINFYEGYSLIHFKDSLRRINFGPFAWLSLMRRDAGLRMVWDHIIKQKEDSLQKEKSAAMVFSQPTSEVTAENTRTILADKSTDQLETQFEKRALQTDGYEELIPYNSIIKARKERTQQKATLNRSALPLGLTFYDGQVDRELQLIDKIQMVLPKRKVVWKLFRRFFELVYPFMPYLDEDYFRADVERIIGAEGWEDERITDVKIERKLDLATVGILLIVVRLGYLSFFSNNNSIIENILSSTELLLEVQATKYLLRNPVDIDAIDVASLCLDQFQILRKSNFTVMQLALYLRLYHTYAPEDGDGADGGDSQGLNAVLFQMGYSMGLNREPDEQCTDLRINNLSRKIWAYLVISDLHLAYSFGCPLVSDSIYFDTRIPFYEPGNENIRDKKRDRSITELFKSCTFLFPRLRTILRKCLDVNGRVSLIELCQSLSSYEIEISQLFGSLRNVILPERDDSGAMEARNMKVKIYLAIKTFLLSVYFHIYLYYEPNDVDVSFFYLKKCLLISTADIMPHYMELLSNSSVKSDMVINPTVEMVIHKANQVNLLAIVRVNFVIHHLRQFPEHDVLCKTNPQYLAYFQSLCQLSSCLTRAAEFTISAINKISNRYYYAWRITKGQTYLLKTITSTQFYEANYSKAAALYSVRYSAAQLDDLIQIIEGTLSQFSCQSEFCTYGFSKQVDKSLSKLNGRLPDTLSSDGLVSNPADGITNSEIDKLWLQVLSMKHENPMGATMSDAPIAQTPMSEPPIKFPKKLPWGDNPTPKGFDVNRFGFDMETASKFDIVSDLPFDQLFNF